MPYVRTGLLLYRGRETCGTIGSHAPDTVQSHICDRSQGKHIMKTLIGIFAIATSLATASAYAICENNPTAGCRLAALESADQQLNFVFKRLLSLATPEKEKLLREAQRSWIEERNKKCGLTR